MYLPIRHLHSVLAILALAFIIFAIVYNAYSWIKKNPITKTNKNASLLGLIGAHIQVLFGLILYFISPNGISNFSGEAMKNSMARLYLVEHPFINLIAILLITIGYLKAKKLADDNRKYKTIVIFYLLGLCLILLRIPWQTWIIFN